MNHIMIRLLVVVLFASPLTVAAQIRVQELTVSGGCNYDGQSFDSKVYTFESDAAAITAVDRILNPLGLVRNFEIKAADVDNAAAVIHGETRYLLYNQAFIRRLKVVTNTDWAAISIMAHEVGHHLNGHTLIPGGSRPPTELEADSFSGFVLYKMGATLEQAEAAINAFSSEKGSSTHPPKRSRLAAIESGWTKAQDQDKTSSKGPQEPQTPPATDRSSTSLKRGIYRASAQQTSTFSSSSYPFTEAVALVIKIESVDGSGNVKATMPSHGEGPLSGSVDGNGNLQLDGFVIRKNILSALEYKVSLKAVVKDNTLTNGKYLFNGQYHQAKGTFNIAIWEEDF